MEFQRFAVSYRVAPWPQEEGARHWQADSVDGVREAAVDFPHRGREATKVRRGQKEITAVTERCSDESRPFGGGPR